MISHKIAHIRSDQAQKVQGFQYLLGQYLLTDYMNPDVTLPCSDLVKIHKVDSPKFPQYHFGVYNWHCH